MDRGECEKLTRFIAKPVVELMDGWMDGHSHGLFQTHIHTLSLSLSLSLSQREHSANAGVSGEKCQAFRPLIFRLWCLFIYIYVLEKRRVYNTDPHLCVT